MKVQGNYSQYITPRTKAGLPLKDKMSFKAVYTPRSYTEVRNLANSIYQNAKGTQRMLMDLYINSGEMLNNFITAVGTAFVAPVFIIFNPVSKEDKETKKYTGMRQPISAAVTLGAQVPIMKAYNNWLDKHAAFLGVDEMDLSAKPPVSVLKPQAEQQYRFYEADCLKNGLEPIKKKQWVRDRITQMQDEAFYKQLGNLRATMDIRKVPLKELVKPSQIDAKKNDVFKSVLKDRYKFAENELEMFKDYHDFLSKGKKLVKAKQLDINLIQDSVLAKAEEAAINDFNEAVLMEAKVKHSSSMILKEMRNEFEAGKLVIAEKYKTSENAANNHKAVVSMEKEIQKLKETIYQNKIESIRTEYEGLKAKSDQLKTEAEKIKEYAYRKIFNAGSMDEIKYHGDTLESVLNSVKTKKWLVNRINKAEAKLKGWRDRSGVVIGLAILPLTCGILNWAYPKVMKKFFPELCEAKAASKAKLYGIQPGNVDKNVKEAK